MIKKISQISFIDIKLMDLFCFFIWLMIFTKIFIFDFDIYLVSKISYFGNNPYLYRNLFILFTLIVYFILKGKNKFILTLLYILFWPFIIIAKILVFLFTKTNSNIVITIFNMIFTTAMTFKSNILITLIYLFSIISCFLFHNNSVLIFSSLIIICLTAMYISVIRLSIGKNSFYEKYYSFLNAIQMVKQYEKTVITTEVERTNDIQNYVLLNRLSLFIGKKLQIYIQSMFRYVQPVLTMILFIFITAFSFAVIHYSISLLPGSQYIIETGAKNNFLTFFYNSFIYLLPSGNSNITAVSELAEIITVINSIFAFFLLGYYGVAEPPNLLK